MASDKLAQIEDVDIDKEGTFKYILISVEDTENKKKKYVVRGYKSCSYHVDIYDRFNVDAKKLGLKTKCHGGGRIKHNSSTKTLFIYGYSQGYGKADHTIAQKLLKEKYPNYEDISWSNEGY